MLNTIPKSDLFSQVLIGDNTKKITALCNNIELISVAYRSGIYRLVLYTRLNLAGRYEAGIIYVLSFPQDLPVEMLRFFSKDENTCFDFAQKYYCDLVAEHQLYHIKLK